MIKNKQRYLKACEITAQEYLDGTHDQNHWYKCEFCKISKYDGEPDEKQCIPCPMTDPTFSYAPGCTQFETFDIGGKDRADFFYDYLIPWIKSQPDSQFTKKGWKPQIHDYSK